MPSSSILTLSLYLSEKSSPVNGFANNFIAAILIITLQLPFMSVAFSQSTPDTRSPVIELEAVAESQSDNAQVFTAQVVDDRVLKEVSLYFRRAGQQPFTRTSMDRVGESSYYSTSIATEPGDLRAIEYYVQARDESGNRTVEGFAFDPYTRVLVAGDTVISSVPAAPTNTAVEAQSFTSKIRWWHVAAGIVVVGALSAASGGSSSGSAASEAGTVPLTVNITGP